jgi:hypothetical protein
LQFIRPATATPTQIGSSATSYSSCCTSAMSDRGRSPPPSRVARSRSRSPRRSSRDGRDYDYAPRSSSSANYHAYDRDRGDRDRERERERERSPRRRRVRTHATNKRTRQKTGAADEKWRMQRFALCAHPSSPLMLFILTLHLLFPCLVLQRCAVSLSSPALTVSHSSQPHSMYCPPARLSTCTDNISYCVTDCYLLGTAQLSSPQQSQPVYSPRESIPASLLALAGPSSAAASCALRQSQPQPTASPLSQPFSFASSALRWRWRR